MKIDMELGYGNGIWGVLVWQNGFPPEPGAGSYSSEGGHRERGHLMAGAPCAGQQPVALALQVGQEGGSEHPDTHTHHLQLQTL